MNAPRCKPGDLAIVVKCNKAPELVGRFVIVERPIRPIETVLGKAYSLAHPPGDFGWMVRSAVEGEKLPTGIINIRTGELFTGMDILRPVKDSSLHPIRPGEGPDETIAWHRHPREVAA